MADNLEEGIGSQEGVFDPIQQSIKLDRIASKYGIKTLLDKINEDVTDEWVMEMLNRSFEHVIDAADKTEEEGVVTSKSQIQWAASIHAAQSLLSALSVLNIRLSEQNSEINKEVADCLFAKD